MNDMNFVTFRSFSSVAEAEGIIETLRHGGIVAQVVDASPPVDITFSVNTSQTEIKVRLKQEDFDKANDLLERQAAEGMVNVPDNHYLHDFSDEELYEIIEKNDEWGKMDFLLSQKLLEERGREISGEEVEILKFERIEDLKKPEPGHKGWLLFGFVIAMFGGLLGMWIGWFHWKFRKTIPTGERVFAYDAGTRKTGEIIFWIGCLSLVIWIIEAVMFWV